MKNRIILLGGAGSGKTTIKNELVKRGFKQEVSYTSRPARDGEVDGVDYNFITKEEFTDKIRAEEFIQFALFGGNWYGTSRKDFREKNLFIMSPKALESIRISELSECLVVHVQASTSTTIKRLSSRGDSEDKIKKRLDNDDEEFFGFSLFDYEIDTTNETCNQSVDRLLEYYNQK